MLRSKKKPEEEKPEDRTTERSCEVKEATETYVKTFGERKHRSLQLVAVFENLEVDSLFIREEIASHDKDRSYTPRVHLGDKETLLALKEAIAEYVALMDKYEWLRERNAEEGPLATKA